MKPQLHFPHGYPHTCYRRERRNPWPRVLGWAAAFACWVPLIALWLMAADPVTK